MATLFTPDKVDSKLELEKKRSTHEEIERFNKEVLRARRAEKTELAFQVENKTIADALEPIVTAAGWRITRQDLRSVAILRVDLTPAPVAQIEAITDTVPVEAAETVVEEPPATE